MAKDRQIAKKGFLIRNRFFDSDLLDTLAQDSHPKVQQLAALHSNSSEKTLVRLAKNPASPTMLLDYLAYRFFSQKVWDGLVTNPNTSEDIFSYLCLKKRKRSILNKRKINAIAKEHKIPFYILKKLINVNLLLDIQKPQHLF